MVRGMSKGSQELSTFPLLLDRNPLSSKMISRDEISKCYTLILSLEDRCVSSSSAESEHVFTFLLSHPLHCSPFYKLCCPGQVVVVLGALPSQPAKSVPEAQSVGAGHGSGAEGSLPGGCFYHDGSWIKFGTRDGFNFLSL